MRYCAVAARSQKILGSNCDRGIAFDGEFRLIEARLAHQSWIVRYSNSLGRNAEKIRIELAVAIFVVDRCNGIRSVRKAIIGDDNFAATDCHLLRADRLTLFAVG